MQRSVAVILIFLLSIFWLMAQKYPHTTSSKALKYYNNAKQKYEFLYIDDALTALKAAIQIDDNFIEAHLLQAEIYVDKKDYQQAVKSYRRVVEIDPAFFPNATFSLAYVERISGLYEDAKTHYKQFLDMGKGSESQMEQAQIGIANCDFSIHAMENPVPFNPVNLGRGINSEYDEYWPSITADGATLVVTVQIPKEGRLDNFGPKIQEDFYISHWVDGAWTEKKNLGKPINTSLNEGAQSLSADGNFMFFTACNRPDGMGSCDIYYSSWMGDQWSSPRNMAKPINSPQWDAHPSISPDGKILYFCSRRPGGKGGIDLWKSTVTEDGFWGEPENLGDEINTSGDEMSPFIHPDNKTLYFSSNGLTGLGDFDLFYTRLYENNKWEIPKNLGYPINTYGEEMGLIVNAKGNKAYFSSTRLSNGGKDIFEFELYPEVRPQEVTYMMGSVFDKENGKPLVARFELIGLLSKEIVMEAYSNPLGEFLVCIPTNLDYALNVSKTGYLFYSDNFSLMGIREISDPFLKDVPLHPLKTGKTVILNNIFFETDSYLFHKKSEAELDKIVQFLQLNPEIYIEISGHTDNVGTPEYNLILSENRAKSVYQYLIEKNVKDERLVYKGYGLSQPIDSNENEAGRAMNRRTELKIL